MDKIDQTLSGAERKAALCQLLDQETQLIGSIGRHKKDADGENREKIVQAFLNKVFRQFILLFCVLANLCLHLLVTKSMF